MKQDNRDYMNIQDINKKFLVGKKLSYQYRLLFDTDQNLFNKEIVICDFEMNGRRGRECEIIEFTGILVHKGIIKDWLHFECRHKEYDIEERLLNDERFFANLNRSEYESRPLIDEYAKDLEKLLSNRTLLIWGCGYDNIAVIRFFNSIDNKKALRSIRYIDFQKCFELMNQEHKNKNNVKSWKLQLHKNFVNAVKGEKILNNDVEILGIKADDLFDASHSSLTDVWKLIFLLFITDDEIKMNNNASISWKIPRSIFNRKNPQKQKNKPNSKVLAKSR